MSEIDMFDYTADVDEQDKVFSETVKDYGSYKSLALDIRILYYFLSNKTIEPISQKLIIEHFKDMHPSTVKKHIYHLKSIGAIKEHDSYRSCYCLKYSNALSVMSNFDTLMRLLLGHTVYDMYTAYLSGK